MAITATPSVGADGIITVAFNQDAAQQDTLVAAPASNAKILVTAFLFSLDAAGTAWFEDSDNNLLSGAFDLAANGSIGWKGDVKNPVFTLPKAKGFQIETTVGKASGFIKYKLAAYPA